MTKKLVKVYNQRLRLLCLENSFLAIQAPPKETFDVKERQTIEQENGNENWGKFSISLHSISGNYIVLLTAKGKPRENSKTA